MQYLTFDIMA